MLRKILLFILVMLFCEPYYIMAQPKPKRNRSNDQVITIPRQQSQTVRQLPQTQERQNTQTPVRRRKRVKRIPETPQHASYLTVNQQTSISRTIGPYSGRETYNVNTDGKDWSVLSLPPWCHVTKYADSFLLSYDANPYHDDRSFWFKVKSDDKEVIINVQQYGIPLNIYSKFDFAILYHNFLRNGEEYLAIRTRFSIKGAKGQKCLIVAKITDENGNSIKASQGYSQYALPPSNDVYTAMEVTPSSDDESTYYYEMYLPNNAMQLFKKRNKLRCHLSVYCVKTRSYINGANYTSDFKAKLKRGKVTTKDM